MNREKIYKPKIEKMIMFLFSQGMSLSEIKEYTDETIKEILDNKENTIGSLSNGKLIIPDKVDKII